MDEAVGSAGEPAGAVRRYATLLADRSVLGLLGASAINAPSLALPVALILLTESHRSVAAAGSVVAANAVSVGLSSPFRGRLLDRYGQTWGMLPLGIVNAAAVAATALLLSHRVPLALPLATAFLAGAPAPLLSALRVLWSDVVVPPATLKDAYALQSVFNEVLYVVAPLAVTAVATAASPEAATLVLAASHLVGVLLFCAVPASRRRGASAVTRRSWAGALATAGMRGLVLVNICLGGVYGAFSIGVAAFCVQHATRGSTGLILAVFSVGSVAGGFAYAIRRRSGSPARDMQTLLLLQVAALVPLPFSQSTLVLACLAVLAGLAVAPLLAVTFGMIDDVAPPGSETEAASWIVTAYAVGTAGGAGLGGWIERVAGVGQALALPCVAAAVAGVGYVLAMRRPSLRPAA